MTIEEAIKHLEFSKKSYQNLIDNDTRIGEAVGKDTTGTWKADTSLATVYQTMRDTMIVAIKSLEAWENVKADIGKLSIAWEYGQGVKDCFDIIDKHLKEVQE